MNTIEIIKNLELIAKDVVPVSAARLAAAVIYKGRVISIGTNQDKTHPFAAEFSRHPEAIFLHAESDAIYKAKKRLSPSELKKSTLVIVRSKSNPRGDDLFGLAKPCSGCQRCIEHHGIKKVIYTLNSTIQNHLKFVTEYTGE